MKILKNSSNENDTGSTTPQIDNWNVANAPSTSTPLSESAAIETVNIESDSDFLYKSSDESGLGQGTQNQKAPINLSFTLKYSYIIYCSTLFYSCQCIYNFFYSLNTC